MACKRLDFPEELVQVPAEVADDAHREWLAGVAFADVFRRIQSPVGDFPFTRMPGLAKYFVTSLEATVRPDLLVVRNFESEGGEVVINVPPLIDREKGYFGIDGRVPMPRDGSTVLLAIRNLATNTLVVPVMFTVEADPQHPEDLHVCYQRPYPQHPDSPS